MFNSLFVVCISYIGRFPSGERLLRQSPSNKKIDSSGPEAMAGEGANAMAADVEVKCVGSWR